MDWLRRRKNRGKTDSEDTQPKQPAKPTPRPSDPDTPDAEPNDSSFAHFGSIYREFLLPNRVIITDRLERQRTLWCEH